MLLSSFGDRKFVAADVLPSCQPQDFHYEYTECDSAGGRWRVSVPKPGICTGGAPNAPVRGKGCDFTCKAGEYLDIENDQECHPCPAGHFSLGGGVRYEDFDNLLPHGFHHELEGFSNLAPAFFQPYLNTPSEINCTGLGWHAIGKFLVADVRDCTAVLMYTANLVQAGSVSFVYQNENDDIFFSFEVENSQCQSSLDSGANNGFLKSTAQGKFRRETFELKSGINVLYWRAFKPLWTASRPGESGHHQKGLAIQSIDIIGVAYTSECTACKAGTFSETGSSQCTDCPLNTFSHKGSSQCTNCDTLSEYSDAGAEECLTRPACTVNDYYQYNSPCDSHNTTQKLYKWIEPQLCRTDLFDSVKLPQASPVEPCPPCNPGMEFINGSCHFCPPNHYSSGSVPCANCPGSTAPQTGLLYKWWNNLDPEMNITANCLSSRGRGCASKDGWIPAGDHINSGQGHSDDVYLMLNLKIGGFRGKEEVLRGRPITVGKISFVFELECEGDCRLTFMKRSSKDGVSLIESWIGRQSQTLFEYEVTHAGPVSFSWAFLKSDSSSGTEAGVSNSMAKIYMINVTNTLRGGAKECKACPKGASQHGCIPCPDGHYVDHNTTKCTPCPAGMVTHGLNPWGVESCMTCGSGLTPSKKRSHCVTSCSYNASSGRYFDYTPIAGVQKLEGSKLFTSSGYKYYNEFHLSLCGGNDKFPLAACSSNASSTRTASQDDLSRETRSPICRVTVLPSTPGDTSPLMYTQQINLGDVLVAVTDKEDVYNITVHKQEAGFASTSKGGQHDVHFVYVSDSATAACRQGITTIVTLRCDMSLGNESQISLPSHCVTGTCDGCTYMLLWRSQYACPRCASENFTEFTDVCINGKQKVLKLWPKDCFAEDMSQKELAREQTCSMLWQEHWPLWLKAVVILVPIVLISGCLMLFIVLHCWLKNRSLQYKYMKLVESAGGKDGAELPAAETCALDEGEDDEQFDAVQYKTKGRKIFAKLSHIGKRQDKVAASDELQMDERSRLRENFS